VEAWLKAPGQSVEGLLDVESVYPQPRSSPRLGLQTGHKMERERQAYFKPKREVVQAALPMTRRRHLYKCTPCGGLAGEYDTVRSGNWYKVQGYKSTLLSTATMNYDSAAQSTPPPLPKGTGFKFKNTSV